MNPLRATCAPSTRAASFVLMCSLVVGCSSSVDVAPETSEPTATPPTEPLSVCAVESGEHGDLCGDGSCAVLTDLRASCDDFDFGAGGVRLVRGLGVTYVAAQANHPFHLFAVDGADAERVEQGVDGFGVHLAPHPSGDVMIAADRSVFDGFVGGSESWTLGGDEVRPIHDRDDRLVPVEGFAYGADGGGHAWVSDAVGEAAYYVRGQGEAWTYVDNVASARWFTLATDGEPVAFRVDHEDGSIYADAAGDQQLLAIPSENDRFLSTRPATASFVDSATSDYALLVQERAGLSLLRGRVGAQPTRVALPGTAAPDELCTSPTDACGTCEEVVDGLAVPAYAAHRASNGDVYVAYAISHLDRTHTWTPNEAPDGPLCNGGITADASTATLVVVKVEADGSTVEPVFELEVEAVGDREFTHARLLDLHAEGDRLGLALRVRTAWPPEHAVRILDLDLAP